MKRVFISLPYSSTNHWTKEIRVAYAKKYFIKLLENGVCPVCPIVTGHQFTETGFNNTLEFWDDYCLSELSTCDEIHILMIPGWKESEGIGIEIGEAKKLKLKVVFLNQEEI